MQLVSSGVIETQVLLRFDALSRSIRPNVFFTLTIATATCLPSISAVFVSYLSTARAGAGLECAYQPQRLH